MKIAQDEYGKNIAERVFFQGKHGLIAGLDSVKIKLKIKLDKITAH